MKLSVFLNALRALRWSEAIDNVTYFRMFAGLTWLMVLGMSAVVLTSVLVAAFGGGKLGSGVTLAVLGLPLVFASVWYSLKVTNARVHDFGFKSRYYWVYILVSMVVQTGIGFWTDAPLEARFVAAIFAISALAVLYYLWMEKGPAKIPFRRVAPLKNQPMGWLEKLGIGILFIITLASSIAQVFQVV